MPLKRRLDIRYQQIFKGEDAVELPEDSYHGEDEFNLFVTGAVKLCPLFGYE